MRLSIREEVAYNRIVTELIETAMAEAVAEIEMEKMLGEMEEYLAGAMSEEQKISKIITGIQTSNEGEKEEIVTGPTEKENGDEDLERNNENEETGRTKDCGKNDEVCQMLDELERKLLIKKDFEPTFVDGHEDPNKEESLGEDGHQKGKTEKKTEDINRKCTDEPSKSQTHRHLSIFTKRRKSKTKVENEDNISTFLEKKAKKEKSILKRLRNVFCCCCKTEK